MKILDVCSLLTQVINEDFIQATFSNPLHPAKTAQKITLRPLKLKKQAGYQASKQTGPQVFHENLSPEHCLDAAFAWVQEFKQVLFCTLTADYVLLTNKKGKTTLLRKKPSLSQKASPDHNRSKAYLLEEKPLPFLIALGIMNKDGRVYPQKMAKYRQINRFLEMVKDTWKELPEKLHILDFGCGKAYLTFSLYHFLTSQGIEVDMIGLDLKDEVILTCQELSKTLNYENLRFERGDIASFESNKPVDMVIALHACNTATDAALAKAMQWKASVILAAPCCHQELYSQIASDSLQGLLQYGILKERFASLATDAARALLLEKEGYATQILEFIDSEHTPKNLLIRAVRGNSAEKRKKADAEYQKLKEALHITPCLESYCTPI